MFGRSRGWASEREIIGRIVLIESRIKQLQYLAFYSDKMAETFYNGPCWPNEYFVAIAKRLSVGANKPRDCSQSLA